MKKDYFNKDITPLLNKKLYLFDMDGTIYIDNTLFCGTKKVLDLIDKSGGKYVFITNNSSKSIDDYIIKLSRLGLVVNKDNFYTSTLASITLLRDKFKDGLIYAQGTSSFINELKLGGLNITEEFSNDIKCVLVGFDLELTTKKLNTTCYVLTKLSVPYYATNPDWVCPVDFGFVPDCGSMCFSIEKATGKTPIFIGKPQATMINAVMESFGVNREDTVVFGDRIYTDIASGKNAGVDTVLVLSGESNLTDYYNSQIKPDYLLNSIDDLI